MRKDKKQVIGEEMSDAAIAVYLNLEPADATPGALHKLMKAYRGLRIDDFARFLEMFKAAGYCLEARDQAGQDFSALVSSHRHAAPYIELVQAARGI